MVETNGEMYVAGIVMFVGFNLIYIMELDILP